MLELIIPTSELWDEAKGEFIQLKEQTLRLEHSLVSLSKWESKWCKPFLSEKGLTTEQTIDYIRCMTLTQNVPQDIYSRLSMQHINKVSEYINAPMTATTINETHERGRINREVITAELVYYWMIALNIPFECQKWHLNRLLTLIKVCNIKNAPAKKMSRAEIMRRNTALNAARRQKLNTTG